MLVVLIEFGLRLEIEPVEIGEQVRRLRLLLGLAPGRLAPQIVDDDLGVDLLLDVERRRTGDQVGRVLFVLAAPDELRIEVAVAPL